MRGPEPFANTFLGREANNSAFAPEELTAPCVSLSLALVCPLPACSYDGCKEWLALPYRIIRVRAAYADKLVCLYKDACRIALHPTCVDLKSD